MNSHAVSSAVHRLIKMDLEYLVYSTAFPAATSAGIDRLALQLLGIERLLTAIRHPYAAEVLGIVDGLRMVNRDALLGRYPPQPALKRMLEALRNDPAPALAKS
jgi:hypothetical protein